MKWSVVFQYGKWCVTRNKQTVAVFNNKEDAMDYVQSCVADDQWNAANRD